jgi:hypothetical protein
MSEVRAERYVSAEFSVDMPSRHPANQTGEDAYNRGKHYYRKDYVKPKSWTLQLTLEPRTSWSFLKSCCERVIAEGRSSIWGIVNRNTSTGTW